ncbi:unnamed protein product [Blepharisma stoltei]|uniref:Receptor ligand binding region domain-containing protein n=1 Tax=Blepharisma stoltei TaxID=1481888 RepID=A0AAU9I8B3_9CILI|nr:unnamed protein product [Blepharisma stoltei]CAG9319402.1 unnamed protein product [Blepharisma stoltei]
MLSESNFVIKKYLESERANYRFSIVNIQNGKRVIIGTIFNGQVNLFKTPLLPGNAYDFPDSSNSKIKISISDGIANYDGVIHRGTWIIRIPTLYAINYANKTNLIKNFSLELHETDCSAEYYEHDFSYNCFLKQKVNFGVVFIPSIHDEVYLGTISDFREMGLKIPVLGDFCLYPALNDQIQFPEFARVVKGFELHSTTMRIFGWKNVVVMYENTTLGITLYKGFMNVANVNGIKVLNDEDKRMVKASYSLKDFEEYKGYLTHAIQTNGRIFALFVFVDLSSHFYLTSHLYDLGLRRGDAIFLLYQTVSWFPYYAVGLEAEVISKCEELYYGSLTFFQAEWVGDFGKQAYEGIKK